MADSSFGAGATPPVLLRIEQALRVRTRIPMARQVDHAGSLIPNADWDVAMEHVGLHGVYRAVLIAVKGHEVKLLTNFILRTRGGHPYLDAPGVSLALSDAVSQPLADGIAARLSRLQFADGGGGPDDASDGAVHFLRIRHGQLERKTALYFYYYPATSNHWEVPSGIDEPRWKAINTVYEIWRDIVSNQASGSP